MARNCKVISVYFGDRKYYPQNADDSIEVLKDVIKNEILLNPGVDQLDTILVNHDCGKKEANEYLDSLDNLKTHSGRIRVIHRPNDRIGMSFASFNYAFETFRDDYDYWFFQEDDYKLIYQNYYSEGIDRLNKNPKLAFLGYDRQYHTYDGFQDLVGYLHEDINQLIEYNGVSDISELYGGKYYDIYNECMVFLKKLVNDFNNLDFQPIADGGMGLTHRDFLDEVYKKNGSLPYVDIPRPKTIKKIDKSNKKLQLYLGPSVKILGTPVNEQPVEYNLWWLMNVFMGELRFANIFIDYGYIIDMFDIGKDVPLIYSYKGKKER